MATNHPSGLQVQPTVPAGDNQPAGGNDNPPAEHNNFTWTLDVRSAEFPNSPVSGKLHGADFTGKRPAFKNGTLKISSASGGESLTIHGLNPSIENSTYEFQLASGDKTPSIDITWNNGGQVRSETYKAGYAMKLKFEQAVKRKVRAQIYLCLPDESKSYVAGTFAVTLPKPKP